MRRWISEDEQERRKDTVALSKYKIKIDMCAVENTWRSEKVNFFVRASRKTFIYRLSLEYDWDLTLSEFR